MQTAKVIQFPTRHREDGTAWEPWLTQHQIAMHFGVSQSTVKRWTRDGMPSALFGGSRRFKISACERWHSERRSA